jgi:hypothetical protein
VLGNASWESSLLQRNLGPLTTSVLPDSHYRKPFPNRGGLVRGAQLPAKSWYLLNSLLQLEVFRLSGPAHDTQEHLEVLYVAGLKIDPYFVKRLFADQPRVDYLCRISFKQVRKYVEWCSTGYNLVMIDLHRLALPYLKFPNSYLIPMYLRQRLDIDLPVDELHKKFSKNLRGTELRKIRKHGYSFRIVRDRQMLRKFYKEMYLPYIAGRHDDLAIIDDFAFIKGLYRNGELLVVEQDDRVVSAAICQKLGDCYFWKRAGVLGGDEELMKRGALSATYYFSILRASRLGARSVDFGWSRPFLDDGVFNHKSRWGTRIVLEPYSPLHCHLWVNPDKSSSIGLGGLSPFVCIDKGEFVAVASHDGKTDREEWEKRFSGRCRDTGIGRVVVL